MSLTKSNSSTAAKSGRSSHSHSKVSSASSAAGRQVLNTTTAKVTKSTESIPNARRTSVEPTSSSPASTPTPDEHPASTPDSPASSDAIDDEPEHENDVTLHDREPKSALPPIPTKSSRRNPPQTQIKKLRAHGISGSLFNIDTTGRNAWGERRFSREDTMIKDHYEMMKKAGLIDADQAARLSTPWHQKGERIGGPSLWDPKNLDPSRKETGFEIMSLKQAKRIQDRKDKAQLKWLADWRAGIIDENGNPTGKGRDSEQDDDSSDGDLDVEDLRPVEKEAANDDVSSEELSPAREIDPTEAVLNAPSATVPVPPINQTNKELSPAKDPPPRKIAQPRIKSKSKSSKVPSFQEASKPEKISTTLNPDASTSPPKVVKPAKATNIASINAAPGVFVAPENGMPSYGHYEYSDLLWICRGRGLKSGGGKDVIIGRLMADDVAIRDGTERRDIKVGGHQKPSRGYKTQPPGMLSAAAEATKRKRESEDEDDEGSEGSGKKMKTAA